MRTLTFRTLDAFVDAEPNMWLENYTIMKHKPSPKAATSRNGVFNRKTGQWGFVTPIDADQDGKWRVYVKRSRRG